MARFSRFRGEIAFASILAFGQSPVLRDSLATLAVSTDREALQRAAVDIASSGDPGALARLQSLLGTGTFLARLDNLNEPQERLIHVAKVFQALRDHPSPATAAICIALSAEPDFAVIPARLNFLLPALAAVRPMSSAAAGVFRRTNREGYYSLNAPLLSGNGSPRALAVFAEIIADRRVDPPDRVDLARRSIVPHRTDAALLGTVRHLLKTNLDLTVRDAIVEAIFDDQPSRFFGRQGRQPVPPGWESISEPARRHVLALGEMELRRPDLPAQLRLSIQRVRQRLQRRTAP